MKITITGVNFKTTPIEIRERLSFNQDEQKAALHRIKKLPCVNGCVMLSTCNRTEVYVCFRDENSFSNTLLEEILCEMKGLNLYDFKKHFYTYNGAKAVRHLFKVASGLDSMILGEDQILGQVKEAHNTALGEVTSCAVLNTLFRNAVEAAKKIKTDTGLSKNPVSIASIAVKQIMEFYGGDAANLRALVIGTGEIGSAVFKNLYAKNVGKIYIANRSHSRRMHLANLYAKAFFVDYEQRYSVMDECDVVVSSTASPHYTITRDKLEASLSSSKKRIFIDLAVPRDIDESIKEIRGVEYLNLDHFKSVMRENFGKRALEAVRAEEIIEEYANEFEKWYEFREAVPIVKEVHHFAEELICGKTEAVLGKLKYAGNEDKEMVRAAITGAVNEIMDKFIYGIRKNGSKEDIKTFFAYLKGILKEKD